jgi:hypothetical protein
MHSSEVRVDLAVRHLLVIGVPNTNRKLVVFVGSSRAFAIVEVGDLAPIGVTAFCRGRKSPVLLHNKFRAPKGRQRHIAVAPSGLETQIK